MISSSAPTAELALASAPGELEAHFAVRRRVFVELQGLFVGTDRDACDAAADTLHAVAAVDGERRRRRCGCTRSATGCGRATGSRSLPDARVHRLGGLLVKFAVRTAGALGGERMVAQVQVPNVRFFERLGWACDGEAALYHGVMHQPMAIPLAP